MGKKAKGKIKITEIDKKIIGVLQDNSRLSCRQISQKVGVSPVTVMKRMKYLEKNKVIRKYGIWLDYEKLGYDICAIIQIKFSKKEWIKIEEKIAQHPWVTRVYDITGPFDALVFVRVKRRKQLDEIVKKIRSYEGVERTETMLVFSAIKEESVKMG